GTIGVLAGGLDLPYPPENAGLCEEIAERGAIISEMPFGWQPRAQDFPRRNRLVAGAVLGLVVVEAAQRSGSLISARLAGEMGRLVFAVPGSPLDPRAAGTNGLLKDGATLVTDAADVSRAIAPLTGMRAPDVPPFEEPPDFSATPPPGESDRARVIEALGPTPVAVDEI
ncbi:DNA-processing protein DprA, partial [Mesorhizobium sp. M7A.F.Ca.CA.004.05.1.1]